MSILISGLDLDTREDGWFDVRLYGNGNVAYRDGFGVWHDIGKRAVPVPAHGDLKDADALLKKCEFVCTDDDEDIRAVRYSIIEDAPTIIPAEEDADFYTKGHLHLGYAEEGET